MVNNLGFRWPKPCFLMVLGAHGRWLHQVSYLLPHPSGTGGHCPWKFPCWMTGTVVVPDVFRSVYDCLATVGFLHPSSGYITYIQRGDCLQGKNKYSLPLFKEGFLSNFGMYFFPKSCPKRYGVDYVLRESEGTLHSDDFSL